MIHSIDIAQGHDLLVYDLGSLTPEDRGCMLECSLRLVDVRPETRVALALTAAEEDGDGNEYPRGMRTLLIPCHHGAQARDIDLPPIRFVFPCELDVSDNGNRRFLVQVDCHYVDVCSSCTLAEA